MSIRLRLMLAVLMVVCLGMWQLYRQLVADLRPRYLEAMEETMVDMAEILAAVAARDLSDDDGRLRAALDAASARRFEARIYALVKRQVTTRVSVTDATGRVVWDSAGEVEPGVDHSRWNDVLRTLRGGYGARATRIDPDDPRSLVLHVAAPIEREGELIGVLSVRRPVDSVTFFIDAARANLLWVLVAGGLGVAVVAAGASLWLTRPLHRLERHVAAVRRGERVAPPRLRGEVGRVAEAVEELRTALEGRRHVERYVQHLTHELKSPLSAIRGAAELLDEDMPPAQRTRFLANIRHEVARIQAVVERLLQLSAVEARTHLEDPQPIELAGLAAEVVEAAEPLARQRALALAITGDGTVVRGDRFLLHQALRNLVANALDFAAATVRIELLADGVAVVDDGPGIPDYARGRVTERFYSLPRPDGGAKGTGLGLPLVVEVAQLHGARFELGPAEGGGTRAALRFPAAAGQRR